MPRYFFIQTFNIVTANIVPHKKRKITLSKWVGIFLGLASVFSGVKWSPTCAPPSGLLIDFCQARYHWQPILIVIRTLCDRNDIYWPCVCWATIFKKTLSKKTLAVCGPVTASCSAVLILAFHSGFPFVWNLPRWRTRCLSLHPFRCRYCYIYLFLWRLSVHLGRPPRRVRSSHFPPPLLLCLLANILLGSGNRLLFLYLF